MKKVLNFISRFFNAFVVTSILIIVGGLIFLYTFPFNVAQLNKINLLNEVQAGSRIAYNVDFCRYVGKGVEIHTRRFLVAEDKELTNPIELSSNPSLETLDGITGCRTSDTIRLPIDTSVPEGKYKLLIQVRYCIFLGRCIPVEGWSEPFDIKKPSISDQLSSINEQLESIEQYYRDNPQEAAVRPQSANVIQPQIIQQPSIPLQDEQPQQTIQQQQTQQVAPNNRQIIDSSLNVLDILKLRVKV